MKELISKIKKYNDLSPVKVGIAVLALYSVLLILISVMHEPWHDEAQAWQIAKYASYHDMIFYLPHYESHPPLWHLILSVPAKLGAPYELSIKAINILFSVAGVFIIEFRSRFTNWVKTFIPFTYFIFYQYGAISRPYSMMLLAILLCALFFEDKDIKPLRFIGSLIFLCLSSDYGLMIAGGITLAWLTDLLIRHKKAFFRELFLSDLRRLAGLIVLLLTAVFIVMTVYPAADLGMSFYVPARENFYMITFVAPAEAFMTDFLNGDLYGATIDGPLAVIVTAAVSVLLWTIGIAESYRRRALHHFIFPCIFFIVMGTIYSVSHHYGIYVMLFLYEFMILRQRPVKKELFKDAKKDRFPLVWRYILNTVMAVSVLISCYWTWSAYINDAAYPYFYTRDLASWLQENTSPDDIIMVSWCPQYEKDSEGKDILDRPRAVIYNSVSEVVVPLDPYFDHKVIDNEILPYQWLGRMSEEDSDEYFNRVCNMDDPDYILTYNADYIPGFLIARGSEDEEYEFVKAFINYRTYKDRLYYYNMMVYRRAV